MSPAEIFFAKHRGRLNRWLCRPRPARPRNFLLEPLESRLLLSADPLTAAQQTAILQGLEHLATWAGTVDNFAQAAQPLPALGTAAGDGSPGTTLGEALDASNLLQSKLVTPVQNYFTAHSGDATVGGLVTVLDNLVETSGAVTPFVSATEIRFDLDFKASHTIANVPVDFGSGPGVLGFSIDSPTPKVNVVGALDLNFSFGLDLTKPITSPEQAFFLRNATLTGTASVPSPTLADFTGQIGFLDVTLKGGTLNLSASVTGTVKNPDADAAGNVTRSELDNTALSDLLPLTATGSLTGSLPVLGKFGTFTTDDGSLPAIQISDSNVFDGLGPTVTAPVDADFAELELFRNITATDLLNQLRDLEVWQQAFAPNAVFDQAIPFVKDTTFAALFDLDPILTTGELIPKITDTLGNPNFASAQELMGKLVGSGLTTTADYDAATNALTYHLKLTTNVTSQDEDIAFPTKLGSISDLTSSDQVAVAGKVEREFTFGVDLSPLGGGQTLADHTFVESASAKATANLTFSTLPVQGRDGFLGFSGNNGSGAATAILEGDLKDPITAGSRITLTGLFSGLVNPSSLSTRTLTGTTTLTLNNIVLDGTLLTLSGSPTITVNVADIAHPEAATLAYNNDAKPMQGFENLGFASVVGALDSVKAFVAGVAALPSLSGELPLIDKRLTDILDYVAKFQQSIDSIAASPVQTVDGLETSIELALAAAPGDVTVTYNATTKSLEVDLKISSTAQRTLPLNLDLATIDPGDPKLQGLSQLTPDGTGGDVTARVDSTLNLKLGFNLTTPSPQAFVLDTTSLSLSAKVLGSGLNFSFAAGPLRVFVQNGRATLDGDGNPVTNDSATFTITLIPDNVDGRYLLSELATSITNVATAGGVGATLPLFYPDTATPLGGPAPDNELRLTINDLGNIAGTTSVVSPNIAAVAQTIVVNDDLSVISNGLKSFLTDLQDALDSKLASSLPLVGSHLKDAAQFIDKLRNTILSKIDPLAAKTADAVRQALFEALGPSGLDLLAEQDNDSNNPGITKFDILEPTSPTADQVEYRIKLHSGLVNSQTNIGFDIGLPGLKFSVTNGSTVNVECAGLTDDDLRVEVPPDQRRSGQVGTESCEPGGDVRFEA